MASSGRSSATSASIPSSSATPSSSTASPTKLDSAESAGALQKFRDTKDSAKLVAWVQSEYAKAKAARQTKQSQWYINMSFYFGRQWVEATRKSMPNGYQDKLLTPKRPYYQQRKTINLTRSFVRTELSKFLSQPPTVVAVPSTAEDQDVRAAYAAEQAWESISTAKKYRAQYRRAMLWMILTGTGIVKTWWDNDVKEPYSGAQGDICFGSITPFHLFVPDIREQEIEDQPFLINAYVKPLDWCRTYFGDALNGIDLQASTTSANQILDEGYLNLSAGQNRPDSCVVYETWIKPGATSILPEGGVLVTVDDHLISMTRGWPYEHGMYPYSKFEHIPTATFYADSPLSDTNSLQREYNTLRSEISEAGRRTARPGLLVAKGSLVPSQITNEPGLVIQYKPGLPKPEPLPLSPLPQYYLDQQDRLKQDWEDITGQHEVSRGDAPAGVTAGTAINYLQEKDDQYLTPQYQSIEENTERIAQQTIGLFVQYVDAKRKIKVIGADGAFDTLLLSGVDLKNGTDIRVEQGSSVGQSKAASDAKLMDMYQVGLLDGPTTLRLMEVGGVQKVLDVMSAAEKKAQRENIKMKMLTPDTIDQANQQFVLDTLSDPKVMQQAGVDPASVASDPNLLSEIEQSAPPVVHVDDFDVHEVHIETHNRFRMSQEYEALPQPIKDQFARHVAEHQRMFMQGQMMNFLQNMPSDGTDGASAGPAGGASADPSAPQDPTAASATGPGAMLAGNGAAPDAAPETTGGA